MKEDKINNTIAFAAIQKAVLNPIDQIFDYNIYQLTDEWQTKQILVADFAKEATSIAEFEKLLDNHLVSNIIISDAIFTHTEFKKILSRHPLKKTLLLKK